MTSARGPRTDAERLRPHVAEWFGHRVFPTVADSTQARRDQESHRCPFLSDVADAEMICVKSANSLGVCTISAGSNGHRQDWLVCPYRALDDQLLHVMIRRLFGLDDETGMHVMPAASLVKDEVLGRFLAEARDGAGRRQFLTFQQLFGGEIGLPRSPASPELSFDVTVVEVIPSAESDLGVRLGRYGVIEVQTTDTHGTYKHAVEALRGALDLHGRDFAEQVAAHPDWPGRLVEGPNISNVFKRTFYQIMFKFQITRRMSSAGCVLALPRPVWDSWQPFLGAPEIVGGHDGTQRLRAPGEAMPDATSGVPNWIYVFDIAEEPPEDGQPTPISVRLVIGTDTPTLSRLALEIAPQNAIGQADDDDSVVRVLRRRLASYVPGIQ